LSPDIRQHRGAHPADQRLFHAEQLPTLRAAVDELSWLLSHGYTLKASVKLVGDRHSLTDRQRLAIARAACSDKSRATRQSSLGSMKSAEGQELIVDGFNLIITVEAALSGAVLLLCRDECIRDLASVHGSYRAVNETNEAINLIGEELEKLKPKSVEWLLDKPISNSGRLAKRIRDLAGEKDWPWTVDVAFNPDNQVISSGKIAITSDSAILDRVPRWINFKRELIEARLTDSRLIDLRS
jgi:hypothetical protein